MEASEKKERRKLIAIGLIILGVILIIIAESNHHIPQSISSFYGV